MDLSNKAAPGVPYYTPEQNPPAGTALRPGSAPTLFKPLQMRSVTLQNRLVVSPMCQYSCADGLLTDYHLVHLGQFALHGAGLTFVEATAVEARGRISPEDSGIWTDAHVPPLRRITDFIHSQGGTAGMQLGHAGRKASTRAPWLIYGSGKTLADEALNGWPDDVIAPSAIPFSPAHATPKELSVQEIQEVVAAFADGARRSVEAGFDVIEIHGAHGYLLTEFCSPLSNKRTDQYGGSFENRTRLLREVIQAIRNVIPTEMPLWVRISATEWMEWNGEPSWDIQESIRLAKLLPGLGVDVLDVSSGGNNVHQRIDFHSRYQADLAGQIRRSLRADGLDGLLIAAVGAITEAEMARSLVEDGQGCAADADLVLAARQFLREPEWVLRVAHELGVEVNWPHQYLTAPKPLREPF